LRLSLVTFALLYCLVAIVNSAYASYFPLRANYKEVATISHQNLSKDIDNFLIVDVRSSYEFSVLHIDNAINIPISNLGFIPALKKLRAKDKRDIVFYCNGITCEKSYLANLTAKKFGLENVYTFDLGVLEWAKLYPEKSMFFNVSLLKKEQLISLEKFQQHMISPESFVSKINGKSLVIDIREPFQRDDIILSNSAVSMPLHKFHHSIPRLKQVTQSSILIFDAVGKQVYWLQYLLEKHGIKDYYFMQGGVKNYLATNNNTTK
jgi:rhodanese-related sulfurtransferase